VEGALRERVEQQVLAVVEGVHAERATSVVVQLVVHARIHDEEALKAYKLPGSRRSCHVA
jgi:hypothetical protein